MLDKNNPIPTFTFIGHFAIDSIVRFQLEHEPTLGGSVTFGPLALRTYTPDVDISIISTIGSLNFDKTLLDFMVNNNINLQGIKWTFTRTYLFKSNFLRNLVE